MDRSDKSITIETMRHAVIAMATAWILWNHTTNPASSQETWTPLSQFKSRSDCIDAARGTVKRHVSTPRTIDGSVLVSPNKEPQKLLLYLGDNLVSAISYECAKSTEPPHLVSRK